MSSKEAIQQQLLSSVDGGDIASSVEWAEEAQLNHEEVVGVINSLVARECLVISVTELKSFEATKEGQEVIDAGSPEWILWNALPADESGRPRAEVAAIFGEVVEEEAQKGKKKGKKKKGGGKLQIALGQAMKQRWVKLDKASGCLVRVATEVSDVVREQLRNPSEVAAKDIKNLERRKLLVAVTQKAFTVSKGPKFSLDGPKKMVSDLTPEMIADGSWETLEFKPYNFGALGLEQPCGGLHPLMKARAAYRQVFLEMGFQEMQTDAFVVSSFWNFDSLFQPQQHPVRDAHDTFFLQAPSHCAELPGDGYWERVKKMHESGGSGSIGWRYDWSEEESRKNLLRTHTTAVSSQTLYNLAQECNGKEFTPKKIFSIDRVFRNEKLDRTHLAEFFQIEGLVADYDLTLGDLMGTIESFFHKIGIKKLKFKPAYNPYTEPSAEIFAWHEGLQEYVEIGNSGMFRPEMLAPMGLPEGVRVIAWGFGLERPTMIRYGFENIRDLCGCNQPIQNVLRNNPIVKF